MRQRIYNYSNRNRNLFYKYIIQFHFLDVYIVSFRLKIATANAVQIVRRPNELRNGSPIVNYRAIDGPRVVEGVRQFETINSYARLVSVGHPAVNELPYPPVREGQVSGSSRPLQQTEPIVVRVPENHSASNQQQQQQYGEQG